jgi:hypothetical protein
LASGCITHSLPGLHADCYKHARPLEITLKSRIDCPSQDAYCNHTCKDIFSKKPRMYRFQRLGPDIFMDCCLVSVFCGFLLRYQFPDDCKLKCERKTFSSPSR